ncbi:MAG: GntR family transcriptional regulator [Tagaea sp.]|nr:GntR family transcriptional regulator [Tagaea sp.]
MARRAPGVASLYRQVYGHLRAVVTEGGADFDSPLPSEPALAERYKVSRVTVRRTLEMLEAEGLVRRVRGVGTFPIPRAPANDRENIGGLLDSLLSYERTTTVADLEWRVTDPSPDAAAGLGPFKALRIVRVRLYRGTPISLTTLHVPKRHAGLLDRATAGHEPIVSILDRKGVNAVRAEQAITAVAADARAAEHLGVKPGAPLVAMKRLMITALQEPVLHQTSLYAPDLFEYRMSLARGSLESAARWTPIA